MKENDYFLNLIANPEFTSHDFRQVGLTTDNTDMQQKSVYENLEDIRNNPLFQTDGQFDLAKFDNAYEYALNSYNIFTNVSAAKDIASSFEFFRNNIHAKNKQEGPEFEIVEDFNPYRLKTSMEIWGRQSDREFSAREIAETQKSWNPKTNKWEAAPNDDFWGTLTNPKVMAEWEFDADADGNPTDDENKIVFRKGQLKLNERGTFYTESLNGRSPHNKLVISGWDVLTKDGSAVNKYDFFDSDDIEKSNTGTLMRTAVKLVPMFIPGVNTYYIPLMFGTDLIGLFSKVGKMVAGSDNKFLNNVQGWTEAMSFSSSDYALGDAETGMEAHPWGMENIIHMAGDVFEQLATQRWIFKYAPRVLGFNKAGLPGNTDALKAFIETFTKNREKGMAKAIADKLKNSSFTPITKKAILKEEYKAATSSLANIELANVSNRYTKAGEYLSKIYMTGITTVDAYQEAKDAGAEDWQAALFTLGYAAAEYGILSTDLGKWILPELRMERARWKDVASTLSTLGKQSENATPALKRLIALKIINLGNKVGKLVHADYATPNVNGLGKTVGDVSKTLFANAIGEGVEEVTEEALYDISKGLYNASNYLFGQESRMRTNFEDSNGNFNMIGALNDYALNFVGGLIGGGLGEALPEFRAAMRYNSYKNDPTLSAELKQKAAYQELVEIIKSGKKKQFMKVVNGMTFGNAYLASLGSIVDSDGNEVYLPGNSEDNQDKMIKLNFSRFVDEIENIVNVTLNGQTVNDNSFIDKQIAGDLRFNALRNSATAYIWLQNFNDHLTNVVMKTQELLAILRELESKPDDITLKEKEKQLNAEIKESKQYIDDYLSGKAAAKFKELALFELNLGLSNAYMNNTFIQYAETKIKQSIETIPEAQLQLLKAEWDLIASMQKKDQLRTAFDIFKTHNIALSEGFKANGLARIEDFNSFVTKFSAADNNVLTQLAITSDINPQFINQVENYENNTGDTSRKEVLLRAIIPYLFSGNSTLLSKYQGILDFKPTTPEESKIRLDDINASYLEIFSNPDNLDLLNSMIDNVTFIDPDTLKKIFTVLNTAAGDLINSEDFIDFGVQLSDIASKVKEKYNTPILQVADLFALNTKREQLSSLLSDLSKLYTDLAEGRQLAEFSVNDYMEKIDNAIILLSQLEAGITAMLTDNVSFELLAGYNATINELNGNEDLATMDSQTAEMLKSDAERIKLQLQFFKTVYGYNIDQKLATQTKLHHKNAFEFHNKALRIIKSLLPEDFEGVEELIALLEGNVLLNEKAGSTLYELSQEERITLEKELIRTYDALGTFINKNIDKLDKLITSSVFNVFQSNDLVVSLAEEREMDDSAFIWKLYTLAALKASNFYKNYTDIISGEVASIPALEDVVYANVAFLTDKSGLYDKFRSAVNNMVISRISELSEEEMKKLYNDYGIIVRDKDNDNLILFANIFFNEGDPGTGKTFAIDRTTASYLNKFHKDLVNDMIVISNTKTNAQKLAEGLGASHALTVEELMPKIAPGYTIKYDPVTGDLVVDNDHLYSDDGIVKYNHPVVEGDFGKPKIVFIDEVTLTSKFDLHKIDEWLNLIGAKAIVSGDFNQLGVSGTFEFEGDTYTSYLHRNMFARTQKLGEALRTANSAKLSNNNKFKASLPKLTLLGKGVPEKVDFDWYMDESGLYGDRVVTKLDDMKETIQVMLDSTDEVINYLHDTTVSELYEYIQALNENGKYKDRFNILDATASQGGEGQYYIIDLADSTSNEPSYFRKFYTALTRAKQGSVIMQNRVLQVALNNATAMLNAKPTTFSFGDSQKANYSNGRKELLLTEGVLNPDTVEPPKIVTPQSGDNGTDLDDGTERGRVEKVKPPTITIPKNESAKLLNMIMHTGVNNELGCMKVDGKLVLTVGTGSRIDGVNGLIKLGYLQIGKDGVLLTNDGRYANEIEVARLLKNIQQAALLEDSVTAIENQIQQILLDFGIDTNTVNIRFGYKHQAKEESKLTGKFLKSYEEEKLYGTLPDADTRLKAVPRKGVYVEIYVDGKLQLEVPVMQFTSPLTLLETEAFKHLNNDVTGNPPKKLAVAKKEAEKSGDTNFVDAANTLFLLNDSKNWFAFFDESFVPSKHFKVYPPGMSHSSRGDSYGVDGYDWESRWYTLSELKSAQSHRYYSSNVFTSANNDITRADGTVVIPKGLLFILVTDYNKGGTTDAALVQRFEKELANPTLIPTVSYILVSPPRLTLRQFLENLNKVYFKDKGNPDIAVGTEVTVLHLINAILGKDKYAGTKFEVDGLDVIEYFKTQNNADKRFNDELIKVEKIIDEMNALRRDGRYTKEAIEKLKNEKEGQLTKKLYLNKFLREILVSKEVNDVYDYNLVEDDSPGIQNPNNRIAALSEILRKAGVDGIFYHINMQPGVKIGSLNVMATDNNTFRGGEILCNVRPDPAILVGDVMPLIESIKNQIDGSSNAEYETGNYTVVEKTPTLEEVLKEIVLPDIFKDYVKSFYKGELNENAILDYLETERFMFDLGYIRDGNTFKPFYKMYAGFENLVGNIITNFGLGLKLWLGRDLSGNLTIYTINQDNSIEIKPLREGDSFTDGVNTLTVIDISGEFVDETGIKRTIQKDDDLQTLVNIMDWETATYKPTKGTDNIVEILTEEEALLIIEKFFADELLPQTFDAATAIVKLQLIVRLVNANPAALMMLMMSLEDIYQFNPKFEEFYTKCS